MKLGDLQLPESAVTETFAYLACRGAGKSNAARVMAEAFFKAGLPFVAVDPVGAWWGLRSSRDGKGPGLSIPIFGGRHGDVPLSREGGELVADLIVEHRFSCVIDLSDFDSESSKKKFLLDFARRLYLKNEEPLHLFLEESDDFLPQRPMRDEAYLLRAWENIVRRGRSRGLGITLITQRSAAVNKNVLTQTQTLVALRTTGPQDRAAIAAWLQYNDQDKEILASLPKLKDGEAWVWSPNFLKKTARVQFPLSNTFDSGATPKSGPKRVAATLADVDLKSIQKRMAATVEKSRSEDPKALRQRIAELEKQLKGRPISTFEKIVERPVFDDNRVSTLIASVEADLESARNSIGRRLNKYIEECRAQTHKASSRVEMAKRYQDPPTRPERQQQQQQQQQRDEKLPAAERKILAVLAQHGQCSKRKLALCAVYAVNGGGFNNALSALRVKGYIVGSSEIKITPQGAGVVGSCESLPTTKEGLLSFWCRQLGKAERSALEVLADAYPDQLSKVEVASAAGYEPAGGGFNNALSKLRTLGLINGSGHLSLAGEIGDLP